MGGPAGPLAPKGEKAKEVGRKNKYKVAKSGTEEQDKKTDLLNVEDVKQEVEESKKKPKPTTTKLKVEKLVVKEEPLLKEKPVLKGRRKAAKSETKADKSVSDSTIQSKVPIKRRRRS